MSDFSIYLFFSFYVFASSCKTQIKDQFSITSAGHQGSPIICGTNAVALLFYRLDIEILLKHIFMSKMSSKEGVRLLYDDVPIKRF